MTKAHLGSALVAATLIFGCARDRALQFAPPRQAAPESTPTARGGGPPPSVTDSVNEAIDRLGAARCEREARCGRVGPDGTYDSRQQCLAEDAMSRLDALDPANCPNGIDRKRVDACVNAMRAEICGSESRSTAGCTISALCASP